MVQELIDPHTRKAVKPALWQGVREIPDFPFEEFEQLQEAIEKRHYALGIDPVAAAEWSSRRGGINSKFGQAVVTVLSVGLFALGLTCVWEAVASGNYLLLIGIPIVVIGFFISEPSSPIRPFVSAAGFLSVLFFADLILRDRATAAWLVGCFALTFVSVRTVALIHVGRFRNAILGTEPAFLYMYERSLCTLRDKKTGRVLMHQRRESN